MQGTCKWKNNSAHSPCTGKPPPNTPAEDSLQDNVFANVISTTIPPLYIVNPILDFPAQLAQARPGPNYPCNSNAPSNVAPPFSFDGTGGPRPAADAGGHGRRST